MGQAGAQREPSMEEILASIRRIIENNEPAADGGHAQDALPAVQDYAPAHAYDEHEDDDGAEDEGRPAPEFGRDQPHVAQNDQPVARPVSLAEVAALARSASVQEAEPAAPAYAGPAFSSHAPQPFAGQPSQGAAAPGAAHVKIVADIDDAATEELRKALTSNEPLDTDDEAVADAAETGSRSVAVDQPAAAPSDTHRADAPKAAASPAPAQEAPSEPETGGQLVSLQTGEKVAAAFGELNAALAAGQTRSFDEIAEEMLRPMLTQWLDDNLPTLVERLVREEIERVSRGNRR